MIKISASDGSVVFGEFIFNKKTKINSVKGIFFKEEPAISSPYASYRLNFDLNANGTAFGLSLVFVRSNVVQIIIFCILGISWDDWNKEMPKKERDNLLKILKDNNIQNDYQYEWGRCYVFDDKKNSTCNLYVDYK